MENTNTEMADIDLEDNNNKDKREEEGTELTCRQSFYAKLRASSSMLRDLEGDKLHVLILFFLYCLQGIPLGLINAVPLILTNKNIPYTEQATFSISGYPFSMKVNINFNREALKAELEVASRPKCGYVIAAP